MIISVETPVFKGRRLQRCIDSVLYQSSRDWTYSLLWDGGDDESRRILEALAAERRPNVTVHFSKNRGIAKARRFLSEHSKGDFILPLDDDDALPHQAIERFLVAAKKRPWASVIRGRREIIDDDGKVLDTPPWFPFEPRHYQLGMVTDIMNHTQPYLIRRTAYARTSGWEGFEDFGFAGEDCDIYLKLEEVGTIELLDEMLYYYRVHPDRQSLVLTNEAAFEMWRRLADRTIQRIGLPLTRASDKPPYSYEPLGRPAPTVAMVDFVLVGSSESTAGDPRASLEQAGVSSDSVHLAATRDVAGLDGAWRRTSRPFVCILDAEVEVEDLQAVETLLRMMHENNTDAVSPKLLASNGDALWAEPGFDDERRPMPHKPAEPNDRRPSRMQRAPWLSQLFALTRREVLNAVGGFDTGFSEVGTAVVDFSLRARQRQFECNYVPSVSFLCTGQGGRNLDPTAIKRLQRKWENYPELFT